MRILYICKRHYMSHDVIEDRYARLYEQPFQLSQLGHEVLGVCLSYRPCEQKDETHTGNNGKIRWLGYSSGQFRLSIFSYPSKLLEIANKFKPELIVASSDCLQIALGGWLAKKMGVGLSVDLYDDYESFGLAKLPFLKYFYRKSLAQARVISCVSRSLATHVKALNENNPAILVLPSTIDKKVFYARNKYQMRESLNIPLDKKIVGTAGGLTKEKGIKTVYEAALTILDIDDSIHFVLAGPIDKTCPPPEHERIHYIGMLNLHKVADFFCTLDVGIVYLRDTTYGRLSFPQKAYEMAACKIPMVVTDIGDMSLLFSRSLNQLYSAGNSEELVNAIINQLASPHIPELDIDDWLEHAKKLNQLYIDVFGS